MSIVTIVSQAPSHGVFPWVLLYIGPDVFLPLASALAAITGVALMFWQRLVGWLRAFWRIVFRVKPDSRPE
jgi:hypothetical protein